TSRRSRRSRRGCPRTLALQLREQLLLLGLELRVVQDAGGLELAELLERGEDLLAALGRALRLLRVRTAHRVRHLAGHREAHADAGALERAAAAVAAALHALGGAHHHLGLRELLVRG